MTGNAFEVLTIGRVGVDLYPPEVGLPLSKVTSFDKFLGGSPTNVAVAASRYGHSSAVITRVGDDGFSEYVRVALRGFGVDDRYVGTDPVVRTPLVFAEIYPPDHFPLLFYREPKAPDINIAVEDLDFDAIRLADIFWTTGTGLSDEPSRSATLAALEERERKEHTIHDLDFRPSFWSSPEDAGRYQRLALDLASVAVGNQEECAVVVGPGTPEQQVARLLDLGLELAIVKMGPAGALIAWSDGTERAPPRRRRRQWVGSRGCLRRCRVPWAVAWLGPRRDTAFRKCSRRLCGSTVGLCGRDADRRRSARADA